MPDSDDYKRQQEKVIREDAKAEFEAAFGFDSIEDAEFFVNHISNEKFKELLERYFQKTESDIFDKAYPRDPSEPLLTMRGYMETAGVMKAFRQIRLDFQTAVQNYRQFEESLSSLYREKKA